YLTLPSHPVVYAMLPPTVQSTGNYGISEANLELVNAYIFEAMSTPEFQNVTIIDNHTLTANSSAMYLDYVHPNDQGALQLAVNVRQNLTGDINNPHTGKTAVTSLTQQSGLYLFNSNDQPNLQATRDMYTDNWFSFSNVTLDPGTSPQILVRLSVPYDQTTLTVRTGSATGSVVSSTAVASTGGLNSWKTISITLGGVGIGHQDLYFSFARPGSSSTLELGSIEWVNLSPISLP
ncbi:MAG: carbohydrate-binding protein, partial [Rhodanobacter sp.]|nr:carbohydrate-binding protein [Rhodanobacter sp.]